jgi:hypothetical protein
MGDWSKVISKFYRLKLTDELHAFVKALPVRNLHESQVGDSIYVANGELCVGHTYYPVGVRVWFQHGRVVAQVKSPQAFLSVFVDPFDPLETAEKVKQATAKLAC